jgi:Domain of unknown function (DUF892)
MELKRLFLGFGVNPLSSRRATMAREKNLQELFHETLKDIYFAEKKILSALPKMAKAAQSEELKAACGLVHAFRITMSHGILVCSEVVQARKANDLKGLPRSHRGTQRAEMAYRTARASTGP